MFSHGKLDGIDSGILDLPRRLLVNFLARHGEHFARLGIDNIFRCSLPHNAVGKRKLFIEFIAAHPRKVVALGVEEQRIHQHAGALHCGRLSRAQALIDFYQPFLLGSSGILFKCGIQNFIFAKERSDLLIGSKAHGAHQHRRRELSCAVCPHPHDVAGIRLKFQPCPAVWDNGGIKKVFSRLIL